MAVVRPAEAGEWGAVGSAVEGQRVVKVDLRVDSGEVQAISAADKEGFNREDFSGEAFNREGFNRVDFNREALAALREEEVRADSALAALPTAACPATGKSAASGWKSFRSEKT